LLGLFGVAGLSATLALTGCGSPENSEPAPGELGGVVITGNNLGRVYLMVPDSTAGVASPTAATPWLDVDSVDVTADNGSFLFDLTHRSGALALRAVVGQDSITFLANVPRGEGLTLQPQRGVLSHASADVSAGALALTTASPGLQVVPTASGEWLFLAADSSTHTLRSTWTPTSGSASTQLTLVAPGQPTLAVTGQPALELSARLRDPRDGELYRTVAISGQIWMAENLRLQLTSPLESYCYDGAPANCAADGWLYAYGTALTAFESTVDLCPPGWTLPDSADLVGLLQAAATVNGDSATAAIAIKSTSRWTLGTMGTDLLGFTATPSGYLDARNVLGFGNAFLGIDTTTLIRSSAPQVSGKSLLLRLDQTDLPVLVRMDTSLTLPIRCLQ
jgi:uncharacterized protein (TIGR02145 family)